MGKGKAEAIHWRESISQYTPTKVPNPLMLKEGGINCIDRRNRKLILVHYDREYVIYYLYNRFVRPLQAEDDNTLRELLDEALIYDIKE
jgi:hypothetical protein